MKKIITIFLLGVILFTGCSQNEKIEMNSGEVVDTTSMIHEHCTRAGSMEDGEVSLNYDIYYTGEVLNLLRSVEKVTSSKKEVLDTYEQAYKGIHEHYQNLEYYDTEVIRENNSVTSSILINYDKIDIQALLAIEGAEDNIIEDGVAKVEKWKSFGKQFGMTCTKVEE